MGWREWRARPLSTKCVGSSAVNSCGGKGYVLGIGEFVQPLLYYAMPECSLLYYCNILHGFATSSLDSLVSSLVANSSNPVCMTWYNTQPFLENNRVGFNENNQTMTVLQVMTRDNKCGCMAT